MMPVHCSLSFLALSQLHTRLIEFVGLDIELSSNYGHSRANKLVPIGIAPTSWFVKSLIGFEVLTPFHFGSTFFMQYSMILSER